MRTEGPVGSEAQPDSRSSREETFKQGAPVFEARSGHALPQLADRGLHIAGQLSGLLAREGTRLRCVESLLRGPARLRDLGPLALVDSVGDGPLREEADELLLLEKDAVEQRILSRIRRSRSSTRATAAQLNEAGVPSRGARWHQTTVQRLLSRSR